MLSSREVTFAYADARAELCATRPVIGVDPRARIREIRLSGPHMQPARLPPDEIVSFYAAYRAFAEMMRWPSQMLTFLLRPGDCLILDNTRILNGRTGFVGTGKRHLQVCWTDLDGLASTLALMRRSQHNGRRHDLWGCPRPARGRRGHDSRRPGSGSAGGRSAGDAGRVGRAGGGLKHDGPWGAQGGRGGPPSRPTKPDVAVRMHARSPSRRRPNETSSTRPRSARRCSSPSSVAASWYSDIARSPASPVCSRAHCLAWRRSRKLLSIAISGAAMMPLGSYSGR
jgi:hypothetical protein